jgi:uroporphyrinogen III methyltransferase/synthase
MNWFESRPLFGQTIAVTRTRQQSSDLTARLTELGANVIETPTIELSPPGEWSQVDEVLEHISEYDWVIFTSQNGVKFAKQRLLETGSDARAFSGVRIAAIGDVTAAAVREELCLKVDLCPAEFVAEALAAELEKRNEVRGRRFLLLRADIARPILLEKLAEAGATEVRDVSIYETRPATSLPQPLLDALAAGELHWITFTSSSTARNLVELLGPDYKARLHGVKLASIGPITSKTLKELGLDPAVQAEIYNVEGLVAAIRRAVP